MISVDTNILVRAIVLDDRSQAERATRLLTENICFVARSVVQELVWVLTKAYRFGSADICLVLEALTQSEQLVIEDEPLICRALDWCKKALILPMRSISPQRRLVSALLLLTKPLSRLPKLFKPPFR